MDHFTIDRQFGGLIWIDVENGIVQNCYNESDHFNARMNEVYKGKEISFLKTDFEERMKGTYHNVRSQAIVDAIRQVDAIKSHIKNNWNLISSNDTKEDTKERLRKAIDDLTIEQSKAEAELSATRERIKTEHNYNFKI